MGEVVLAPILHPSGILRGQWSAEPSQIAFLRRAWNIAQRVESPFLPNVRCAPPGSIPTPTLRDVTNYLAEVQTLEDQRMACDIEGTRGRLIGVGFCRLADEKALYIPILDTEWEYWREEEWPAVDVALRALLAFPLIMHNGQAFDVPFLESCGYQVPQYIDDTMILHHILYAEMGKSLEELAILYLGFPSWKWLSKVGELEEGK